MTELPDPLVPAECDLRGFSSFMLDIDRLLSSELWALATPAELRAALALWMRCWKQTPCSSLPNDEKLLSIFSETGRKWPTLRVMALRGYVLCNDGRFYHPVIADQALKAWKKRKTYQQDQERLKRWREAKRNGDETQSETVTETPHEMRFKTHSQPVSKPDRQGQGQGQGQKKERIETPIAGEGVQGESGEIATLPGLANPGPIPEFLDRSKSKPKRKTALNGAWVIKPNDQRSTYAKTCGMSDADLKIECDKFENHHRAKGNLMADWEAAWRTWCRNWQTFKQPAKSSPDTPWANLPGVGRR